MIPVSLDWRNEDLICPQKQLEEKMRQVAEQTKHVQLNFPEVVKFFTICPEIFVKSVVTIPKIHSYIVSNQRALSADSSALRDIIIVCRRRLLCWQVSQWDKEIIQMHFEFFESIISSEMCPPALLCNEFIKFQLAANSAGICMRRNFPEEILSFGELSFDVFFSCIIEIATRPHAYDFQTIKPSLMERIEEELQKFIQNYNPSEAGKWSDSLKKFILKILQIYNKGDENAFRKHILDELVVKSSFGCLIFALLKKIDCISLFKQWIQLLIDLGKFKQGISMVEFTLFYYSNLSGKLQIGQLVERNQDWGRVWITELVNKKLQMIEGMFLNGVPEYLIILNQLLVLYNYESEEAMWNLLEKLGYEGTAKSMHHTEESKKSMTKLLSYLVEDPERIVSELTRQEEFKVFR